MSTPMPLSSYNDLDSELRGLGIFRVCAFGGFRPLGFGILGCWGSGFALLGFRVSELNEARSELCLPLGVYQTVVKMQEREQLVMVRGDPNIDPQYSNPYYGHPQKS